ncbi:MobV family relaxase [Cellulophaga sp. HaHa_2_1]|uniref:MobV family relaxase n=1 Tax=Cellulophaga sp. HaHa_2_1 TaxID=2749994 RepID=UPI001C4F316A|nr:MobV family relaxase [Cellulophaga sp. HaHa_2_1]QXP52550.1 plasmid recombination protein [Cellulophaga sp. HaHa_2_1]
MSYAVMRIMKIKGDISGLGKHIDRASNGETVSPQNANPDEVNNNIHWDENGYSYNQKEWTKYTKNKPLQTRINNNIKERYKLDKRIRKDAVKAVELIFSSDHQKMNEIFSEEEYYKSWISDNKEFVIEHFGGKENIISMHLHADETTYHMEVVVTPITKDGRLSAKSFIDGKKDLIKMQTSYAERMEKYGMKRGEKGSSARHQKPNKFKKINHEHHRN